MVCASIVAAFLICVAAFTLIETFRAKSDGLNITESLSSGAKRNRPYHSWYHNDGANLSEDDRYGFLRVWVSVLEQSKSDPQAAVRCADFLLSDLMEECGCAVTRSAQSGRMNLAEGNADINAEIQTAHEIALHSGQGRVNPIEVKRAIRLYTEVFDKLVG